MWDWVNVFNKYESVNKDSKAREHIRLAKFKNWEDKCSIGLLAIYFEQVFFWVTIILFLFIQLKGSPVNLQVPTLAGCIFADCIHTGTDDDLGSWCKSSCKSWENHNLHILNDENRISLRKAKINKANYWWPLKCAIFWSFCMKWDKT